MPFILCLALQNYTLFSFTIVLNLPNIVLPTNAPAIDNYFLQPCLQAENGFPRVTVSMMDTKP